MGISLQGNGTNVLRIIPYSAVQFAAYEEFKKVWLNHIKLDAKCITCHYLEDKCILIELYEYEQFPRTDS